MFVAPQAELDDGQHDVIGVGEASRLRFVAKLPKVFKGTHLGERNITVLKGSTIEIAAAQQLRQGAHGASEQAPEPEHQPGTITRRQRGSTSTRAGTWPIGSPSA